MTLSLLTPTGVIFEGEITHATLPGEAGSFGVYPAHAPLISSLKAGEIVVWQQGGAAEQRFAVKSGFAEVLKDKITVCAEL